MENLNNNSRWQSHRGSSTESGQKGFIVTLIVFFILLMMLSVALSMISLIFYRQQISINAFKSTQSYYAAEAGMEDALMKLRNNSSLSISSTCSINGVTTNNCYILDVNGVTASIIIPIAIAGSRTVTTQGNNTGIVRKVQTIWSIDNSLVNFYYGVSVGSGGLQNDGTIHGNVFSNGNITGSGTIDNNVVISGHGNSIKDVYVGGDVLAYSCLSSASVKNLTYVSGGFHTCSVRGTTSVQSSEISSEPMPIPQSQIDSWKNDAVTGGTFSGNKIITTSQSLGPLKITGDLTVKSGATLTLTGTLWVVGNVLVDSQNTVINLDSSFGSLGGIIVSDGTFTVDHPNITLTGTGQQGSYLLIISTNTSDTAIDIKNNLTGYSALYTSKGGLTLRNGVSVVEATGYKIIMINGSEIQYSTGVENIFFSSGSGGKWKVTSWGEK